MQSTGAMELLPSWGLAQTLFKIMAYLSLEVRLGTILGTTGKESCISKTLASEDVVVGGLALSTIR
jgi:hypothetical protein